MKSTIKLFSILKEKNPIRHTYKHGQIKHGGSGGLHVLLSNPNNHFLIVRYLIFYNIRNIKYLLLPDLASKAFFNLSTNAGLLPLVSKPRAPSSDLRSTTFIFAGSILIKISCHHTTVIQLIITI